MTEGEIQDLLNGMVLPPLEESDITIKKLARESGLGENTWRERMHKYVESGAWKTVYKRSEDGNRVATYTKV